VKAYTLTKLYVKCYSVFIYYKAHLYSTSGYNKYDCKTPMKQNTAITLISQH